MLKNKKKKGRKEETTPVKIHSLEDFKKHYEGLPKFTKMIYSVLLPIVVGLALYNIYFAFKETIVGKQNQIEADYDYLHDSIRIQEEKEKKEFIESLFLITQDSLFLNDTLITAEDSASVILDSTCNCPQ